MLAPRSRQNKRPASYLSSPATGMVDFLMEILRRLRQPLIPFHPRRGREPPCRQALQSRSSTCETARSGRLVMTFIKGARIHKIPHTSRLARRAQNPWRATVKLAADPELAGCLRWWAPAAGRRQPGSLLE